MKFGVIACALAAVALALSSPALARGKGSSSYTSSGKSGGSHGVRGYTRKDGTHVAPHRQTNPNATKRDNWSTKGNVNPHTGKKGTKDASK